MTDSLETQLARHDENLKGAVEDIREIKEGQRQSAVSGQLLQQASSRTEILLKQLIETVDRQGKEAAAQASAIGELKSFTRVVKWAVGTAAPFVTAALIWLAPIAIADHQAIASQTQRSTKP